MDKRLEEIATQLHGAALITPGDVVLRSVARRIWELEAESARYRKALEESHRYALAVVGASEAYGETESAHLWNEIAAIAETALWPAAQPAPAETKRIADHPFSEASHAGCAPGTHELCRADQCYMTRDEHPQE